MAIALLVWMIFCFIGFIRQSRNMAVQEGFTAHVKCVKCKTEYEVSAEEFARSYMVRYKSVRRTKRMGPVFVNQQTYSYYAKKFRCPVCGRKRYAQILNIHELNQNMTRPVGMAGARWLLLLCLGGILILAAAGIPLQIVHMHARRQAEELRQQRYEELWERYMGDTQQ